MSTIPAAVADAVRARSDGWCEAHVRDVCRSTAEHLHHVVLKSRGGLDTVENLRHVCSPCHHWIHANPADATARGLMGSKPPEGSASCSSSS